VLGRNDAAVIRAARNGDLTAVQRLLGKDVPLLGACGRVDEFGFSVIGDASLVRWRHSEQSVPEVVVATEHTALVALACHPRRSLVAVAPAGASVELRHGDTLTVVDVMPELAGATALDFSPNGRWLAAATPDERVLVADASTGQIIAEADAGERTNCVVFSPDGTLLATACSFQGGAYVRLDRVDDNGRLEHHADIDRAAYDTASEHFVDTISGLAFTTAGRLAIWETSAIHHDRRPVGWRGNLVVVDVSDGRMVWERSIDADVTGKETSLEVAGSPMGYFTTPVSIADHNAIAVGLDGAVVVLNAEEGGTRAVLPASSSVITTWGIPCTNALLVAADSVRPLAMSR
jgi:dipeptidyl aminopeptidase/acylaminoacyl peptidase